MNDGVLVSREWLERANDILFGVKEVTDEPHGAQRSIFYDIRPAVLASEWALGTDGVYYATARFITPAGVPSTTAYKIYAPTATASPGGTVATTRFNIVWRGRWELLGAPSSDLPAEKLITKTVATGLVANVSDDGWLTISATGTTIHYYGESSQ
ncbi:MAG: hypothetical protein IJL92_08755 [Thermoguttaceae bacterium]|nr:hypothetical protein [Thermoguttaceae bacterium]